MNQTNRINYGRSNETVSQAFMHSCLGKSLILLGILVVLLIIAYFTAPSDKEMREEMNDAIMQCMEMNDSIRGDQIDDYVHNIGFIFTKADTTKIAQEWREAFDKYNRLEIYRHTFFTTAYIYNNIRAEGVRLHVDANPSVVAVGILHSHIVAATRNLTIFTVEHAIGVVEVPENESVTHIRAHVFSGKDGGLVVDSRSLDKLRRSLLVEHLLFLGGAHCGLSERHIGDQSQTKNR